MGEGRRQLSARRWRRPCGAEEGGLQPPAVSRRLGLADAALRDLRWLERARGAFVHNKMRDKVRDKLSKKQYDDEVSWTTRTWSSLMAQRMSVALHMAAAWEIARELSLAGAEDRPAEGRARDIYIFLPCRRAFRLRARGTRRAGLFLLSG